MGRVILCELGNLSFRHHWDSHLLYQMIASFCHSKFPHRALPCLLTSSNKGKAFGIKKPDNYNIDQIIAVTPRNQYTIITIHLSDCNSMTKIFEKFKGSQSRKHNQESWTR